MWTIEKVKEELPVVKVKFPDGTIFEGQVGGRRLDFPKVSVNLHGYWINIEYSWSAICHALNSCKPLLT